MFTLDRCSFLGDRQLKREASAALPQGGSMADGAMDDDGAQLAEARSLQLPERLVHKYWKARAEAYLEITKEAVWAADALSSPLKDFGAPRFRSAPFRSALSRACTI